jgi:hypothetical protein
LESLFQDIMKQSGVDIINSNVDDEEEAEASDFDDE